MIAYGSKAGMTPAKHLVLALSSHEGGRGLGEDCSLCLRGCGRGTETGLDLRWGHRRSGIRGGEGPFSAVYMMLSTGIGVGIYANDQVWRGADSYAGEIGHLTIRHDGPECLCGARGCFERMCGGLWLERDQGRTARDLMLAPAFVRGYVVDLALGLKSAIMLLNPARIVI